MKRYIYLFLLLLIICTPAIAGTIHSYTLKSPPDDADEIVIYDSDDGSTKKIEVGDISGSGSGINWSSYTDLTSLGNANEFIVNDSGTSKSINWEVFQTQLPSSSWISSGGVLYPTTTTDTIGIGTTENTNTISLAGSSSKSIGIVRNPSNSSGVNLTINAGGGTSGGTDLSGGDLILQSGQSTGTGKSNIILKTSKTSTTGSSDNIISERLVIVGGRPITEDTDTALFDISLSAGTTCGGQIFWETSNTDGTELQAYSGITSFAVANKGGTYTTTLTQNPLNDAKALTSGTIQTTWSITNGSNKITINVNNNSSFTPASGHPRINYQVMNNCYNTLTIL